MAHHEKNFCKYWLILLFGFFLLTDCITGSDLKEWGEVAPEYLNMTIFSEDTSAAAIRIFDESVIDLDVNNGVEMFFKRHYQTKILKEKGKEFADVAISYWHEDMISGVEAQVIQPDGKIIELDGDNVFDEELSNKYKVKKFTFPEVQVGSVLEVKYVHFSSHIHELEPWYFHQSIPVIESEIILHLSPIFTYSVKTANDPDQLVQQTNGNYHNKKRDNWETEFRFKAINLPAIKNEPFISCLNNYRANVNFQIKSVNYPGYHYEFITDINSLCNTLLDKSYEDFDEPESETEDIVRDLITTEMNNTEKAKVIFEYVRDNFTDDIGTSIYVVRDQEEILEQKKASDTEKNMLLKVMLQAAGLEVMPVLISTRSHGEANPDIPFLSQYNKTILLVNIDGNYFLFDARDPWITYGQLPTSSLVNNALLIQRDNPTYISIPNNDLRSYEVIESHLQVSTEGLLSGSSQLLGIGYASADYNRKLHEHKLVADLVKEELADDIEGFNLINSDSTLTAVAATILSIPCSILKWQISRKRLKEKYTLNRVFTLMKAVTYLSLRNGYSQLNSVT